LNICQNLKYLNHLLFILNTTKSFCHGEVRMVKKNSYVADEEWKILEQKIKIFQEHIANFQKEVEKRLIDNSMNENLIDKNF